MTRTHSFFYCHYYREYLLRRESSLLGITYSIIALMTIEIKEAKLNLPQQKKLDRSQSINRLNFNYRTRNSISCQSRFRCVWCSFIIKYLVQDVVPFSRVTLNREKRPPRNYIVKPLSFDDLNNKSSSWNISSHLFSSPLSYSFHL